MSDNAVSFEHVTKVIGRRTIIDDISFSVKRGEIYGLVGANGAGKTTIMRMLTGLVEPTKGDIHINGTDIRKKEEALSSIGAIIEGPDLYKNLSGKLNMKIMANMYPEVSEQRIQDVVKEVGLEHRINDKVKTYSLGMRQRLGIAVAMLNEPKLLVLDEPLNGLDPQGIREMRTILKRLATEENATIIISSHILSELELVCDRFCMIHNGKIVEEKNMEMTTSDVVQYQFELLSHHDMEKAGPVLHDKDVTITGLGKERFMIEASKEEVAEMISHLVRSDVNIVSVVPYKESLEEYFMDKVGGINE